MHKTLKSTKIHPLYCAYQLKYRKHFQKFVTMRYAQPSAIALWLPTRTRVCYRMKIYICKILETANILCYNMCCFFPDKTQIY